MFKSIRQIMAWLHSWFGLLFGWFIFVIFLTGSLSYYKQDINLWSEPHIAHYQATQETAIQTSYQYLLDNADANAKEWHISLAEPEKQPLNRLFWFDDENFQQSALNPETGEEVLLNHDLALGDFIYRFHYQFYGTPPLATRTFIAFISFILLLVLISGIITHKKIFTEFFTLRAFKSQRSWLDVHNTTAVLALPFFITITFTGLMFLFYLFLPQGLEEYYTGKKSDYFREIREQAPALITPQQPAEMLDIQTLLNKAQQHWGDAEIARIAVISPHQNNAIIRFEQRKDQSITLDVPRLEFSAITGELLPDRKNRSHIAQINSVFFALHIVPFAQSTLRFALFFSGLLGCVMIATGLLLWSIKRQIQNQKDNESLGQFFVDRLNIGILLGLPIAIIGSFYAVRLDSIATLINIDEFFGFPFIRCFFFLWLFSFIISLLTPKVRLWKSQLIVLMLFCFTLPIVDLVYLFSQDFIYSFSNFWLFFKIDLFILLLGFSAIILFKYIHPIELNIQQKIASKTATEQQNSAGE